MENQHRLIKGYGELDQDQIDTFNYAKELEQTVLDFLRSLDEVQPRWRSIAKTHFEEGFMALGRSITRPNEE